jgi:CheY-like chemotaxis protein
MTRILSVSYDQALLSSRQLLLESLGCQVVSVSDFRNALQHCNHGSRFDLFVLGHSIPSPEKQALVDAFRAHCSAPVVALKRIGEEPTSAADFEIEPEPGQLLQVISRVISGHAASA